MDVRQEGFRRSSPAHTRGLSLGQGRDGWREIPRVEGDLFSRSEGTPGVTARVGRGSGGTAVEVTLQSGWSRHRGQGVNYGPSLFDEIFIHTLLTYVGRIVETLSKT